MDFIKISHFQALIGKIKELYVAKKTGYDLSQNDLTDELKQNYDTAYEFSQEAHAPANAQENVLESVKVNGVTQSITGKAVDIIVPTAVSELTNDSNFQTAAQVSGSITTALSSYSDTAAMNTAIAAAVAAVDHLKREIVAALPDVAAADERVIYMVPKTPGETDNVYTEYLLISGAWEIIGDTKVDLTGYIKESDLVPITEAEIEALFN